MTNLLHRSMRGLATAAMTLGVWLAGESSVLAQQTGGGGGPKYVLPYFVVILSIFLGVLVVCHSSRRRDRAEPEKYENKSFLGKE